MIISQTNKKQVVREELRKLMKEKIASDCSSSKRIESPLAKYLQYDKIDHYTV